MWIFQVGMALFAVFMLYVLRIHYRKEHIGAMEFGLWVGTWFGFIVFALFPTLLQGVADTLRIGRIFDLLVIIAFIILSTVAVTTRLTVLDLEKKLERLVRLQALQTARNEVEKRAQKIQRAKKRGSN